MMSCIFLLKMVSQVIFQSVKKSQYFRVASKTSNNSWKSRIDTCKFNRVTRLLGRVKNQKPLLHSDRCERKCLIETQKKASFLLLLPQKDVLSSKML